MEEVSRSFDTSYDIDDVIPPTPYSGSNNIKKRFSHQKSEVPPKKPKIDMCGNTWHCNSKKISISNRTKNTVENTSKGDIFVYHDIRDVLKYETNPANNYFRVIGKYMYSKYHIPYIVGFQEPDSVLFCNVKPLLLKPDINNMVEIFGHLEFEVIMGNRVPIIIAQFWTKLEGDISSYIECLRMQKKFLPPDILKEVVHEGLEEDSLAFLQDLSFSIVSL